MKNIDKSLKILKNIATKPISNKKGTYLYCYYTTKILFNYSKIRELGDLEKLKNISDGKYQNYIK